MKSTHAIVVGSGIAGLCTARVLREFYDRVTIIEQDRLPAGAEHRQGVPQSHHVHALLAGGQLELERSFPGFGQEIMARGALPLAFATDFAIFRRWGWAPRISGVPRMIWCSRPLIESTIRDRVRALSRIEWMERTLVNELIIDREHGLRVVGVLARNRDSNEQASIAADLVVDASGRGNRSAKWFDQAGLPRPPEELVNAHAGYASRLYRRPAPDRQTSTWWQGAAVDPIPPGLPRAGLLYPIEDNRWMITAYGVSGDYPPASEEAWLEFLDTLGSPVIARAVRSAEPISEIVINRSTVNRFRHYERWSATVAGFIATGDSVCALNPYYGQGMTAAAVSARTLETVLRDSGPMDPNFPRVFFDAQARFLSGPWRLSTSVDFEWPKTEGERPKTNAVLRRYFRWLRESSHHDPAVTAKVMRVFHLIDEPHVFVRRDVVASVLRSTLARRGRGLLSPVAPLGTLPPPRPAAIQLRSSSAKT